MARMSLSVRRTFCRCSFAGVSCASYYSSAHISSGHGGEGRVRRIDYTPSDCGGEINE